MEITYGGWAADVDGKRGEGLTEMEATYLVHLASGMTQKEIARATGRQPKSVRHGLERAYYRLGVSRCTAALAKAQALGWIKYVGVKVLCLALTLAMLVGADDGIRNRVKQRVVRRHEVVAIYA